MGKGVGVAWRDGGRDQGGQGSTGQDRCGVQRGTNGADRLLLLLEPRLLLLHRWAGTGSDLPSAAVEMRQRALQKQTHFAQKSMVCWP